MSVNVDGLHADPVLVVEPGRHTAPINRLDADREGQFLVTASNDKTVRVWAAADGRLLRTLRLPAGPEHVGKASAAAISPDGALVAAGGLTRGVIGDEGVYLFDRAGGRLLRRIGGLPHVVNHLAFSPDGTRLAATIGRVSGVVLIDPVEGSVLAWAETYGGESYGAAFDPASGRLATTSLDGKIRLYDPELRLLREAAVPDAEWPFGLAFSSDGRRLAVGYSGTIAVDVLDGATLERLFAADTKGVDNGDLGKVAWSADGGTLYATGRLQVDGINQLRRWPRGGQGAPADLPLGTTDNVMALRPLADGRLAYAAGEPRLGVLGTDNREAWSVGPAKADFRDQLKSLAVAANGARVRFGYRFGGKTPTVFSLPERRLAPGGAAEGLAAARTAAPGLAVEGWENGREPTLNGARLALDRYEAARSLAVAPDGARFALGADWSLRLFNRIGREQWRLPVPDVTWAVNVSADGQLVVAAYGDGTLRWHRLADGAELLALYPHTDRERWVLWTPRGYYDASPGADELIGWHVNRGRDGAPEFYTASRFRDRFYRPDVIDLVLRELDIDRAVEKADAAATRRSARVEPSPPPPASPEAVLDILPPTVAIIDPPEGKPAAPGELVVTYTVSAPEHDPPARVKVLVDGDLAGETVIPPSAAGQRERRLIVTVPVGGSLLTLMARNAQGWSDPVTVRLGRAVMAAPAVHQPTATLYVLAVGVNQYKNYSNLELEYAVADAEDFCNRLLPQEDGLYKRVLVRPLVDANATWQEVLEGFEWLKREMTEEDVAMILLSGHGINDSDGNFHFLPHDAKVGNPYLLRGTCVGYDYIKSTLRALADRGKTLLFLDACHSGGIIPGAKRLPPDIGAIASDLARAENGVIVFASCTGGQESLERPEWQNGAFTEALLEALAGEARRDGDRLRVSDIADYVKPRVRELTAGAQTPVVLWTESRFTNPPVYLLR